jgi:nucleotidyltransferase substrate binding protein (TIGR01987 family)
MNEEIDISKVIKARDVFERFRKNLVTDQDKAGAVQAFEFSYELSWKIMKHALESEGYDEITFPKDAFRKAALMELIDDPETWFEFRRKRNLSAHIYDEVELDAVVSIFDTFSFELNKLIERLKALP